jgi:hypothetical protein
VADQPRFVAVPQEHARAAFPDPLRPERAEAPGEPESRREPRPESKREARVEPHQIRHTDGEPHEAQRAESERPDDAEVRVSTVAAQPAARTRRPPVAFAVYALAVAGTAAVFLVGFHSGYAASVAALTAVALSLGIDSLRVARRQAVPPPHAQPPRSQNP